MNLSEMRAVLAEGGIQLTKSLGQNFLHDGNQLRRIVGAAELGPGDRVLEIGPGLGPMTELLLAQAGEVLAIEKDGRLVNVLQKRFAAELKAPDRFRLLHADALDYLRDERPNLHEWKMVSNLPYSVASPILVELAAGSHRPARMVATLQMEVARRIVAPPGGADYGLLTLLLQLDYEPGPWFKVPASCFFPEPEVDSACVELRRRAAPLLPEALRPNFTRLVKRAFSQRRKMMLKLLKQDWAPAALEAAFAHAELSPQIRAEQVSLAQFVTLTSSLAGGT